MGRVFVERAGHKKSADLLAGTFLVMSAVAKALADKVKSKIKM